MASLNFPCAKAMLSGVIRVVGSFPMLLEVGTWIYRTVNGELGSQRVVGMWIVNCTGMDVLRLFLITNEKEFPGIIVPSVQHDWNSEISQT
jgi:hypothetical protein